MCRYASRTSSVLLFVMLGWNGDEQKPKETWHTCEKKSDLKIGMSEHKSHHQRQSAHPTSNPAFALRAATHLTGAIPAGACPTALKIVSQLFIPKNSAGSYEKPKYGLKLFFYAFASLGATVWLELA